jgi:hypothetical protein
MTEREAAEKNAVAWLEMSDDELVRCSASLGLPAELHPEVSETTGVLPTKAQVAQLRKAADAVAAEHTDAKFVSAWVKQNRD